MRCVCVLGGHEEGLGRGAVDGLPGRAAADGVPHCEGRRLASRGGRGGLEGHCSQSASRHQQRARQR